MNLKVRVQGINLEGDGFRTRLAVSGAAGKRGEQIVDLVLVDAPALKIGGRYDITFTEIPPEAAKGE